MSAPTIDTRKRRAVTDAMLPPALPGSRPKRRGQPVTITPTDQTRPHRNPYVGSGEPQPLILSETSRLVEKLRERRKAQRAQD